MEGEDAGEADQEVGEKDDPGGVTGHVEVFEAGAVAGKNSPDAELYAEVPEEGADDDQPRLGERGAAKAGEKPEGHAESGLEAKAVEEAIQIGRVDAPVSQPCRISEEIRGMEFD